MSEDSSIETLGRFSPLQIRALAKLGVRTIGDLLYHFPVRYDELSESRSIASLQAGERATVYGKIKNLKLSKAFRKKIPMAEGIIEDESGRIKAVWFNQPYLAKMLAPNSAVRVVGKVATRKGEQYLANPEIETVQNLPSGRADSLFGEADEKKLFGFPVYPESRGVTSRWFYYELKKVFKSGVLETLTDPIPEKVLKGYNLPSLKTALIWIHTPQKESDSVAARKRFAFEEVFLIQLLKQQERKEYASKPTFKIAPEEKAVREFMERFPFEPTGAQGRAVKSILNDFKSGHAMSRLLEGDVGSGKTAVAATTAYAVATSRPFDHSQGKPQDFGNLGVAYMAPTEILAAQHFESFIAYFKHLPISIGLITGSGCRKFPSKVNPDGWTTISRPQLLRWVENGEIPILIGTHALIQKTVRFKNLAYIIIDEQHRFGTAQRQRLARKGDVLPHLLSMTATPIPRTLALTIYGDLDLTLLDEMPVGRKPIVTELVPPADRTEMYERVRRELKSGRQCYVICPRIDEPDPTKELALEAKSVKAEAARLKKEVFQEFEMGILHSKLKPALKDKVMRQFANHELDILVATSVVEVGVNVPNATVIVIEGAERFGLSQLHQLRGRVLRSEHQAYCFVMSDTKSGKTFDRLKALKDAKNGFELSELDLKLRGAGELYGRKQWGISDIGMEAMKNIKMVEAARTEAKKLIEEDPELIKHPLLRERLSKRTAPLHFE